MLHRSLTPVLEELLTSARTATLATIRPDGRPRLVPICYVLASAGLAAPASPTEHAGGLVLLSPLDEKPKSTGDPGALARVRDIRRRPDVEVLVERWDEDWTRLAWARLDGTASVLLPGDRPEERGAAIAALRAKYPQYAEQRLEERPLVRIAVERLRWWDAGLPR